jgi:hypothetical protein
VSARVTDHSNTLYRIHIVPGLSFFNELTPNVIAALAGAGATLVAAAINLRIAWRREVLDRMNKRSPRSRRGLLIAITILVVASAVGGYAGALYLMQNDQQATRSMRVELRQRIAEIKETASRLEQTRVGDRASIETEARLHEDRRRGAEGVGASSRIGPCRARPASASGAADAAESAPCKESDVTAVGVCVSIPASANVYEVTPYARVEGDGGAWEERRATLGAIVGSVRFAALPVERPDSATLKNVCVDVWSWESQRAVDARVVVRYLLPDRLDTTGSVHEPLRAASTNSP